MINDNDLLNKINEIESSSELKSVEFHSNVKQQWREAIRKRIIFIGLPVIAAIILIIIWIVTSIPSYNKCYQECLEKSSLATMQRQEDCDFRCKLLTE
jgi:uncharacterized membrane protein